jgi:hypothetical protein
VTRLPILFVRKRRPHIRLAWQRLHFVGLERRGDHFAVRRWHQRADRLLRADLEAGYRKAAKEGETND